MANTFTVSTSDAHSHTVTESNIPASSQLDAIRQAADSGLDEPAAYSALLTTDTWTVTVSQP